MRTKTTFFLSLILVVSIGLWSCSEEDAVEALGIPCADYYLELQDMGTASSAFSQNPTIETCEAYKSAMVDFYNEFRDCEYVDDEDYQDAMDDLEAMDCSEYD